MKHIKLTGSLMIAGATGVFIPYTVLSAVFNYPMVLREDPGGILKAFHAGGTQLILIWLAFGLLGLPLLAAYVYLGRSVNDKVSYMPLATTLGIISGVLQIVGILRWVFVVPALAAAYVQSQEPAVQSAARMAFVLIHQFGGVLLGETLGQLFTVLWTALAARALQRVGIAPRWLAVFGYVASLIYFLAQADTLATVIPGFPVVPLSGLIGSTLWLVWLILTGLALRRWHSTAPSEPALST